LIRRNHQYREQVRKRRRRGQRGPARDIRKKKKPHPPSQLRGGVPPACALPLKKGKKTDLDRVRRHLNRSDSGTGLDRENQEPSPVS